MGAHVRVLGRGELDDEALHLRVAQWIARFDRHLARGRDPDQFPRGNEASGRLVFDELFYKVAQRPGRILSAQGGGRAPDDPALAPKRLDIESESLDLRASLLKK